MKGPLSPSAYCIEVQTVSSVDYDLSRMYLKSGWEKMLCTAPSPPPLSMLSLFSQVINYHNMQHSMCEYLYFQFRGASNAVGKLVEECSGDKSQMTIVTHSSGNHAQAIALASKLCGVQAHIIMPMDAPAVKKESVKGYGAQITECTENTKEVSHKWYSFKHLLILTLHFCFYQESGGFMCKCFDVCWHKWTFNPPI